MTLRLLDYLYQHGDADIESLAAHLNADVSELAGKLMLLEIEGRVTRQPCRRYALSRAELLRRAA